MQSLKFPVVFCSFQVFLLKNTAHFIQYFSFDIVDPDVLSQRTYRSTLSVNTEAITTGNRDFKILVENKSNTRRCIHLVASTVQDKEAWISDISQCIDNIHLHSMMSPTTQSIGLLLLV